MSNGEDTKELFGKRRASATMRMSGVFVVI